MLFGFLLRTSQTPAYSALPAAATQHSLDVKHSAATVRKLAWFSWLAIGSAFASFPFIRDDSGLWSFVLASCSAFFAIFVAIAVYVRSSNLGLTSSSNPLRHDLRALLVFALFFSVTAFSGALLSVHNTLLAHKIETQPPRDVMCLARFAVPESTLITAFIPPPPPQDMEASHSFEGPQPDGPSEAHDRHFGAHRFGRRHHRRHHPFDDFRNERHNKITGPHGPRPGHFGPQKDIEVDRTPETLVDPFVDVVTDIPVVEPVVVVIEEPVQDAIEPVSYPEFGCTLVSRFQMPKNQAEGIEFPEDGCPMRKSIIRMLNYIPITSYGAAAYEPMVQVCSPGLYEYNPILLDGENANPFPACFDTRYFELGMHSLGLSFLYGAGIVNLVIFLGILTSISGKFAFFAPQQVVVEPLPIEDSKNDEWELSSPPAYEGHSVPVDVVVMETKA